MDIAQLYDEIKMIEGQIDTLMAKRYSCMKSIDQHITNANIHIPTFCCQMSDDHCDQSNVRPLTLNKYPTNISHDPIMYNISHNKILHDQYRNMNIMQYHDQNFDIDMDMLQSINIEPHTVSNWDDDTETSQRLHTPNRAQWLQQFNELVFTQSLISHDSCSNDDKSDDTQIDVLQPPNIDKSCGSHIRDSSNTPLSLHSEGGCLLSGEREVESSQKANAFWEDETKNCAQS